jgi:hypothetical protein
MSGGIFPDRPFAFNIKCIIFTLIMAGGYWYLPKKNWFILIFLLWAPYVSLAWYDYIYDCRDKMMPTVIPFGRYFFLPFKPPYYKKEFDKMSDKHIAFMDSVDHVTGWSLLVFSIFIIIYLWMYRKK